MIIGCLSLYACEKDRAECFERRGDEITDVRELAAYSHLHLNDRVDVELQHDSSNFAEVTFGENGIGGIEIKQEAETLIVSETNICDWMRKTRPLPKVVLHYNALSSIYSENSGKVLFNNAFKRDSLKIEVMDVAGEIKVNVECKALDIVVHTGATDIDVEGKASSAYIYNSGYAPLHAEDLIARTVSVHNNSASDTYVNAWETIYYQIFHQGDIYITGPASVVKWHQEGGGQIFFK